MTLHRRDFLKTLTAGTAVVGASSLLSLEELVAAQPNHDKKISSRYFEVEIKGMYSKVPGVVEADPSSVTVTVEEATQGDKPEHRSYGQPSYGNVTLTVLAAPGTAKLLQWAEQAVKLGADGDEETLAKLRRDVTVNFLAKDKKTIVRSVRHVGCAPVSATAHEWKPNEGEGQSEKAKKQDEKKGWLAVTVEFSVSGVHF